MASLIGDKLETIAKNTDNLASKEFICDILKQFTLGFYRREAELYKSFEICLEERDAKFEAALNERDMKFEAALKERDSKIYELQHQLSSYLTLNNDDENKSTSSRSGNGSNAPIDILCNDDESCDAGIDAREKIDVLLIGDSIIKYVDTSQLTNGTALKSCIPGARANLILPEISQLSQKYVFTRVVIHVGTNYIPHKSGRYIRRELIKLLDTIQELLPNSDVVLSEILPRTSPDYMNGINNINRWMREYCLEHGMGHIQHHYFGQTFTTDRKSICWDGVHLNYIGVAKLQGSLARYLRGVMRGSGSN